MKKLLLAAFLLTGCAHSYSAGGHVTDACEQTTDARAPGYTIYVCPRPFPSKQAALQGKDCAFALGEGSRAKGPYVPCGWTDGFTDKAAKEVFVYDTFLPENLEHELLHVQGRIGDDQ